MNPFRKEIDDTFAKLCEGEREIIDFSRELQDAMGLHNADIERAYAYGVSWEVESENARFYITPRKIEFTHLPNRSGMFLTVEPAGVKLDRPQVPIKRFQIELMIAIRKMRDAKKEGAA